MPTQSSFARFRDWLPGSASSRRRLAVWLGEDGTIFVCNPNGGTDSVWAFEDTETFKAAVARHRLGTVQWVLIIPQEKFVFKYLSLPAQDAAEIRQMLTFEVPSMFPHGIGDIHFDAIELGQDERGFERVLAIVIPDQNLRPCLDALKKADVVPDVIWPDSTGLWAFLLKESEGSRESQDLIGVFVGQANSRLIRGARGQFHGAQFVTMTDPVDAIDLLSYAPKLNGSVAPLESSATQVALIANGEKLDRLTEQITDVLDRPEVQEAPGVVRVALPSCPNLSSSESRINVDALSHAAALGACGVGQISQASEVNVLPEALRALKRNRLRRFRQATTAALVMMTLILLGTSLAARNHRLGRQIALLNERIDPIADIAQEIEAKKEQIRAIDAQVTGRSLPLDLITELYRVVPGTVSLSDVQITLDGLGAELTIRGQAKSLHHAFSLPDALEGSEWIQDVHIDSAQHVSRGGGSLIEFACRSRAKTPLPKPKEDGP